MIPHWSRAPPPPSTLAFDRRFGNTRDRFLNEQNHLSYQKLHIRKRLVLLMLLKSRQLVSKFENPTAGAESPFSTMRKIPRQSRKELHLQLAASCGVYHGLPPWFSMHFKSIGTFLAKSSHEKKIRSVDERWHLRSANSASITTPSHWPCGDVWVRACNVWLQKGPSYSMNVVVHIGKQRPYKPRDCHQILTSSRTVRQRQNDDLRFCLLCEKCNGEVDGSGRL